MDHPRTDAYLRRIGADRPSAPTADALRTLHVAHLLAVPFENLSVHLGEEIVLDADALVAKLVDRGRGGFCYELNGAFGALLSTLGFEVTPLQARVVGKDGRLGIPYDHMALRVRTAEGTTWLTDVGFGTHTHYPLAFDERGEQADPGGVFRIEDTDTDGDADTDADAASVEAAAEGDLLVLRDGEPQYLLEQHPRMLRDFEAGAWYHRTSPASHFTQSLVCSRLTEDGRITLSGHTLTATVDGRRTVTELPTDASVLEAYDQHFGIILDHVPPEPNPTEG
ncbi:arylamine N-acetyltransferase [Streptomyces sp. NBC_00006]|uniref:arylamine N-acetyltransferase family protein n=1 Tax=Streptomyces sp. NBC_00006 TaxID=2975619 RepID=UPI002256D646|nr:arylamine N-acetyltransferase [Streptomyces sp. NBC_00006]MCX5536618.1 arylamine N-acetyltransferase [Streptomyces sp. NBC_00006]